MVIYVLISAIMFFLLGIIWKADSFINFVVKVILIVMSIIGLFYWLIAKGFILKL